MTSHPSHPATREVSRVQVVEEVVGFDLGPDVEKDFTLARLGPMRARPVVDDDAQAVAVGGEGEGPAHWPRALAMVSLGPECRARDRGLCWSKKAAQSALMAVASGARSAFVSPAS